MYLFKKLQIEAKDGMLLKLTGYHCGNKMGISLENKMEISHLRVEAI